MENIYSGYNNIACRKTPSCPLNAIIQLHYGSDADAEMAATYHSVIGTVKLHGCSI
jgi:transposase